MSYCLQIFHIIKRYCKTRKNKHHPSILFKHLHLSHIFLLFRIKNKIKELINQLFVWKCNRIFLILTPDTYRLIHSDSNNQSWIITMNGGIVHGKPFSDASSDSISFFTQSLIRLFEYSTLRSFTVRRVNKIN